MHARSSALPLLGHDHDNDNVRRPADRLDASVVLLANLSRVRSGRPPARGLDARGVLALQRTVGNRVVGEVLRSAPQVQRDDADSPPIGDSPRARTQLLPGSLVLADPGEFMLDKPSLAAGGTLPVLPPGAVTGLIDWGDIGTAYRIRRLTLEDRDRGLIVEHWQRWYPVAQALHKLPIARSLFTSPAEMMNAMSAKMIDSALAGDNLDPNELFNRQAEQVGVKTSMLSGTVVRF